MSVQAADVHLARLHTLEADAGECFGAVVIADAEGNTVDNVLKEVSCPQHGSFLREGRQRLEPDGIRRGQLVGTASLFDKKRVAFLVQSELDIPSGKTAQKFHKGASVDAGLSFFPDFSGIGAREFDIHIRGHERQMARFSASRRLKPDGAQIGCSRLAGDDGGGFLQPIDDLFLFHCYDHMFFL